MNQFISEEDMNQEYIDQYNNTFVNNSEYFKYSDLHVEYTSNDVKWIPNCDKVIAVGSNPLVTNAKGVIGIYNINEQITKDQVFYTKHAINCMTCCFSRNQFAVVHTNGKMKIYDYENMKKAIVSIKAHNDRIIAIYSDNNTNDGLIVTGGDDGVVKLWDIRTKDNVLTLATTSSPGRRSCSSVYIGKPFGDSEQCIFAGYDTGDFVLYDIRNRRPRITSSVEWEITDFALSCNDTKNKKMCVTSAASIFKVVDLEASLQSDNIVSINSEISSDFIDPIKASTPIPSINTCVSYLPNINNVFIVGNGNGAYTMFKDEDIDNNINFGSCTTIEMKKITNGPIKTIDWSNQRNNVFISCDNKRLILMEITKH